jgi:hypothetical protein
LRASIAHIVRAILLAKAMATSIFGFLANMRASLSPGRPPPRPFQWTTETVPTISKRRIAPAISRGLH